MKVSRSFNARFGLTPPIWMLGWVSFFTDMASEMIYPLLPLFLTQVLHAGAMSLGVIEGAAEAANSALKVLSGWLADRWRSPKKLVLGGYGLASAARPLIGIATVWPQVLAIRFADRLGKGIRGAPRDAMLADMAREDARGRVFSFHRAMDHAGAVTGPLIASAFLYFRPGDYRPLFLLTTVPGIVVILLILRLPDRTNREPRTPRAAEPRTPNPAEPRTPHPAEPRRTPRNPAEPLGSSFYKAMAVILLFSLGNASDAFLLLRLSDLGTASLWIPLLWSALHVVKVGASLVGGALSDRFGRRSMIALGWLWYAAIYAGFGVFDTLGTIVAIFLAYGIYFGLTEGNEKAWVADMAPVDALGTAFGIYNAVLGIGTLAASLVFGWIWTHVSPRAAFLTGAGLALVAAVAIIGVRSPGETSHRSR